MSDPSESVPTWVPVGHASLPDTSIKSGPCGTVYLCPLERKVNTAIGSDREDILRGSGLKAIIFLYQGESRCWGHKWDSVDLLLECLKWQTRLVLSLLPVLIHPAWCSGDMRRREEHFSTELSTEQ